ncbi:MAG: tetratricopeptide repeat protein [Campylobacter hyointestinalis]
MYESKKITELRKNGKLKEARNLAINLLQNNPNDEYLLNAYAWVLYSIVKLECNTNLNLANNFFNELCDLGHRLQNDMLTENIKKLRPKLNPVYADIERANELSKNGKTKEAVSIFYSLKQNGQLNIEFHENYGWALYRYAKAYMNDLNIDKFQKILHEYLRLENEKPSMLHSMMLNLAINYSKEYKTLNIFEFFQAWNPKLLQAEDYEEKYSQKDAKNYPSLVSKLIKTIIEGQFSFDINYLICELGNKELVVENIRESFFWMLINAYKENKTSFMWSIFNHYVNNYSIFGGSHWHSEILKLAERYMADNDLWRFFEFIKIWNIENFLDSDYLEEKNENFTNKPLVFRSIKKLFECIKVSDKYADDIQWVLDLYNCSIDKFDDNVWLLREYALLLNKIGNTEDANKIYKNLILELKEQAYIWHEFGNIIKSNNRELAISMFCKALTLQNDEDMIGNIMLDLSELLLDKKEFDVALTILIRYKAHREEKGWKLPPRFQELLLRVDATINSDRLCTNIEDFYHKNKIMAEEYILSDIPTHNIILSKIFKDKNDMELLVFTDFKNIELISKRKKHKNLKNAKINDIFAAKLYFNKSNQKYSILSLEESTCTFDEMINNCDEAIAIVNSINAKKGLFYCYINLNVGGIVYFDNTDLRPNIGDFIKIKYSLRINKKENKKELDILKTEKTSEINESLIKKVDGELRLKYKKYYKTVDFEDLFDRYIEDDDDNFQEMFNNIQKPDFAFIEDYYVPKSVLEQYKILSNDFVKAKALFNERKKSWEVFEIMQY